MSALSLPDDAAPLDRAWRCYHDGDPAAALALGREVVRQDPGSVDAVAALIWFALSGNHLTEAEEHLTRLLRANPDYGLAHWYQGLLHRRRHETGAAEAAFRRAITLAPDLAEAHVSLGWLQIDADQPDQALIHAEAAVALGPLPHRRILLGWAMFRLGRLNPALALFAALHQEAPNTPEVTHKYIEILLAAGRYDDAERLLASFGPEDTPAEARLQTARLHLARDNPDSARQVLADLTDRHPEYLPGWRLRRGMAQQRGDQTAEADCLTALCRLLPLDAALAAHHAALRSALGQPDAAAAILRPLLDQAAPPVPALLVAAQRCRDQSDLPQARLLLHRALRRDPANGIVCSRLSEICWARDRRHIARLLSLRACRLAPHEPEVWRTAAWQLQDMAQPAEAAEANRHALALEPGDRYTRIQTIHFTLPRDQYLANRLAEALLAEAPEDPAVLLTLGQVRMVQQWYGMAEDFFRRALTRQPALADGWSGLARCLTARNRHEEALEAWEQALALRPRDPGLTLEQARLRLRLGQFDRALAALAGMTTPEAIILRATALTERAYLTSSDQDRAEARRLLTRRLRHHGADRQAALALMRLAASGHGPARRDLALIPRHLRMELYRGRMEQTVAASSCDEAADWSALAAQDDAGGPMLVCGDLYLRYMRGGEPAADINRAVRRWARHLAGETGQAPARPLLASPDGRLRVAYLAPYLHTSLLLPVLAAHDPDRVAVTVYTASPGQLTAPLAGKCQVWPWDPEGIEASLRMNAYDVVVDTVGIHPFCGQEPVLRALSRRVAPVQCGWLGANWSTAGGIYDVMVLDEAAAPDHELHQYGERILRIPGGQWAWQPPLIAPAPGPVPSLAAGRITFGVTTRGFRFSRAVMGAWAEILRRLPRADLAIMGGQSQDWRLRHDLTQILAAAGVAADRVQFHDFRPYAGSLAFFRRIDVALDCFPGAGGLCNLDALWMGVPLITLSGDEAGWSGARQGASILASIGQPRWIAATPDAYIALAVSVAEDTGGLIRWRETARQSIAASPLCDGRRVAGALEDLWTGLRDETAAVGAADSPQARARALAALPPPAHLPVLTLPSADAPDLAIVITGEALPGFVRQVAQAIADEIPDGTSVAVWLRSPHPVPNRISGLRHLAPGEDYRTATGDGRLLLLASDAILLPGSLRRAMEHSGGSEVLTARSLGESPVNPEEPVERHDRLVARGPEGFLLVPAALRAHLPADPAGAQSALAAAGADIRFDPAIRLLRPATRAEPAPAPRRDRQRILILDNAVPYSHRGAGLPRARLMVSALAAAGSVTFYPLWESDEGWADVRTALPSDVEVILHRGAAGLEAFLSERQGWFDSLLVSRPPNMAFVRDLRDRRPELFAGLRILYDAEAVFAVRENAEAALKGSPLSPSEQSRRISAELKLAEGSDAIISVSEAEARLFRAGGYGPVIVAGHAVPVRTPLPGEEGRRDLLFIGALAPDTPNEDSLLWFAEAILPLLPPEVSLTIVGDCRSNRIARLAGPRIRLAGAQDDLIPWYDSHRAFIAPTRYAAGVPAKIIEAAAHGIPVVATPLLARQLGWQGGHHLLTGDTPAAFAGEIRRLLRDDALWQSLQTHAHRQVADQFSAEEFSRALTDVCFGKGGE